MNKIIKYQIISISEEINYKDVFKELFQLQCDTRDIKNKTVQHCWEYNNFSSDYKKEHGSYPDNVEILGYKGKTAIQNYANNKLKTEYIKFYSGNLASTIATACKRFDNDKKDIMKGVKSVPSFNKEQPIEIHNNALNLEYNKDKNEWIVNISLFSREYKNELNISKCSLPFKLLISDNSQKVILERCLDNVYKISASQLKFHKNKWFLYLNYSFKNELNYELNPDNVMGIDMGIVYPVYMAFNYCKDRYKINGGEIDRFRLQIENRKKLKQEQGKYCGDGRIGHGVKTRTNPIYIDENKISNFRDTINHKYSKYVVDMAVKHNCGLIQMEDLTGISKDNTFLKNWSYFDLQTKITYKANEKGIMIKKVNPKYTSQRCSKCGYIDTKNRPKEEKGQAYFKCIKCGFQCNADYNSGRNLSTPNIDTIIENTLKEQKENLNANVK